MPEDYPHQAMILNSLGVRLGNRYMREGTVNDLEEAIQIVQKAISRTSEDDPNRAMYLNNLGVQLGDSYARTRVTADLEEAISYHQAALRQLNSSIITRIVAGEEVIKYCAMISDWQQAFEASEIAIHLIPKLISRSFEIRISNTRSAKYGASLLTQQQ
jgi:tetratricopeptide (TPR) repeat protein